MAEPREDRGSLLATPFGALCIREGFTPREQFSASQLETADCQYQWALRYLLGLRKPEPDIDTPEDEARALSRLETCDKRERSLLFGKLLHKRLENWYRGAVVNFTDDVGQRALAGLQFLPERDKEICLVEAPISIAKGSVFAEVHITFVGFVDLEASKVYDYKSTGDFRWMKRPDELRENLAACLYALSSMQRRGKQTCKMRWVYFASVGKPEARPVDFEIAYDEAMAVVRAAYVKAHGLVQHIREYRNQTHDVGALEAFDGQFKHRLQLLDHIPKNENHCNKYGGCVYHYERNGPCHPGPQFLDFSNVTEPKQQQLTDERIQQDMQTLQERLNAMQGTLGQPPQQQQPPQGQTQYQQQPPQGQVPQGFTSPGPWGQPAPQQQPAAPTQPAFNPTANPFAGAPQQQPVPEGLTSAPPQVQPFNPSAVPTPVANPFAQAPTAIPVQPQAPVNPNYPPAFPGNPQANPFGQPPTQQPAPVQPFPGVNPPEAATAMPAAQAATAPQPGKRKRRTQAEMAEARAAEAAAKAGGQAVAGVQNAATASQDDSPTLFLEIIFADGTVKKLLAPEALADSVLTQLGI